MYLNKETEIP